MVQGTFPIKNGVSGAQGSVCVGTCTGNPEGHSSDPDGQGIWKEKTQTLVVRGSNSEGHRVGAGHNGNASFLGGKKSGVAAGRSEGIVEASHRVLGRSL